MHLVDEVELVGAAGRGISRVLVEGADAVDAVVAPGAGKKFTDGNSPLAGKPRPR